MKKDRIKIFLVVSLMLIEVVSIFFAYQSYLSKPKENKVIRDNKSYAIMLEDKDHLGTYNEYPENSWPGIGYILNIEMSSCVDSAGTEMEGLLTFNNETRIATVKSRKETYCYLYFKYDPAPEDIEFFDITPVKTNNGKKYTNLEKNKATLRWKEEDIQYFCLTEKGKEDCNWMENPDNNNEVILDYYFEKLASGEITNGDKKVYAYTKDFGGSTSPRKEVIINYDSIGPTVTPTPNGKKNSETNSWYKEMNITLTGNDGVGIGMQNIKYCITTNNSCTPDKTLNGGSGIVPLPTDSKNQKVCYQGTDLLGQKGASGCTGTTYQVDGSKPTIIFDDKESQAGTAEWFLKALIKTSSDDTGSGVESLKTCVTTGASCNPNSTNPNNQLGDNKTAQRVCAEVIDKAGNSSGIKCTDRTYKVDGTPPNCGPTPNKFSYSVGTTSGVTGNVNCTDETSGCTSTTFGFTNLKTTSNVEIKDNAGNTAKCPVPINPQPQQRTASCHTGNRCSAAGCENGYYYSGSNCDCSGHGWVYDSSYTMESDCIDGGQSGNKRVTCHKEGKKLCTCTVEYYQCTSRYSCNYACNYYYQNASTCGCASWNSWSGWSNVPSCSASTGNTSKTECQTIYS